MEASSDEEVQEAAMQVLRNIYGSAVKEPIACAVSRWGGDPYSRGQFSCCPSCHLPQQRFNQSSDSEDADLSKLALAFLTSLRFTSALCSPARTDYA